MDLKRAYVFRLYPDIKRQKEIDERLLLAQQLYNIILEKSNQNMKRIKLQYKQVDFKQIYERSNKRKQRFPKALFSNKA